MVRASCAASARAPDVVVNDALVALVAGATGEPGVVIICGTGSIAYGRSADNARRAPAAGATSWATRAAATGSAGRAPGRGARGRRARPAHLAHTARAQPLRCCRGAEPIHEVYQSNLRPAAIGSLARCVQSAFSAGDEAASGILRAAADELESFGVSVARRLDLGAEAFPFILGGGFFAPCRGCAMSCRGGCLRPCPEYGAASRPRAAAGAVSFAIQEATGGARIPRYRSGDETPGPPRIAVFTEAAAAAHALTDRVVAALARNPRLVLGLPTGRTPIALLHTS